MGTSREKKEADPEESQGATRLPHIIYAKTTMRSPKIAKKLQV